MSQTMLKDKLATLQCEQYRLKEKRGWQLANSFSEVDQPNLLWEKHLANARISWDKLTEQELIKSQGGVKELAGLVQRRYSLSYLDAEKQVNAFLKKYKYKVELGEVL